MGKKVYLDNLPRQETVANYLQHLQQVGVKSLPPERLLVEQALGRTVARAIRAQLANPHYPASAMDGYAVRAETTFGASETKPARLLVGSEAVYVDTGDVIPAGYDAVVMIEQATPRGEYVEINGAAAPWQHIRLVGEDIAAGEVLAWPGDRITPYLAAALLAANVTEVEVRARPRVAVFPTGTELVEPGSKVKPGDILEFNSRLLAGLIEEWDAVAERQPALPDDYELLKARVAEAAANYDLVVINAGSSAGSEDFTARVIAELGTLVSHGVAIKPGKPVILGEVQGKPVIGLPGYPVSAALTCELFVKPVLELLRGGQLPGRATARARLVRKVVSPLGQEEFVRVKLLAQEAELVAVPLGRGAGAISSLVQADGLLVVPRLSEGFEAGTEVEVQLFRPLAEIQEQWWFGGTYWRPFEEKLLELAQQGQKVGYYPTGSQAGFLALSRGEVHGTLWAGEQPPAAFPARLLGKRLMGWAYRESEPGPEPGREESHLLKGAAAVMAGLWPRAWCSQEVAELYQLQFKPVQEEQVWLLVRPEKAFLLDRWEGGT